jgi:hypothetical protein
MTSAAAKTSAGRFFEDFRLGETIRHAKVLAADEVIRPQNTYG